MPSPPTTSNSCSQPGGDSTQPADAAASDATVELLLHFQDSLETLHHVDIPMVVTDFLVDAPTRRTLPGAQQQLPEQLFVREVDGEVDVALHIAPHICHALEQQDPREALHHGNIEPFTVALEGVSHFVLLAWRAQYGLPVKPLELELQAEVDKFVTAWFLLAGQGHRLDHSAPALLQLLFERFDLHEGLSSHEAERYHTASKAAHRFCSRLAERAQVMGEPTASSADQCPVMKAVSNQVRTYYRSGLEEKLAL